MDEGESYYDTLVDELETRRAALPGEKSSFFNRPMSEPELIEWLSFQAYYELRAAEFIGRWLTDTPERDAFVLLAQQVEDEALHYEYFMRCLERRGISSIEAWRPEPEWEEWIDHWYPSGDDTIERVASHNLAGELGACNAFEEIITRVPDDVVKTLDRTIPDEHFHMRIARTLIDKYAIGEDERGRVRERVLHTFDLEQAGRVAFNRRMTERGLADEGDPTPPMPG